MSESELERGRVRGVDLYGRSPLDSGPEAVGIGSFHSIPCAAGWARGKDGLQLSRRKPKSSKAGFVQRPQNAPGRCAFG